MPFAEDRRMGLNRARFVAVPSRESGLARQPAEHPKPVRRPPMTKLSLGILAATVAMFIWGAAFWMSPMPYAVLGRTLDDAAAGRALLEHFPADATYVLPGPHNPPDTLTALHRSGPLAMVHLRRAGGEVMAPAVLAQGFLQELITVMLMTALLLLAGPALPTYFSRVRLIAVAGIAVAVFTDLGAPIWWRHPWPFHLVSAVYTVTAWCVAGSVLAACVPRRSLPPPAGSPALA